MATYRTPRPHRVTVPTHVQPTVPGQPPRPKPKKKYPAPAGYLGGWATNPNLNAKKFKTVKTGKGYFIAKKLKLPVPGAGAPGAPKPPVAPKPPPGPYDSYPAWARTSLTQMDSDRAQQQAYGLDIQKWLTGSLAPIQAAGQAAAANYKSSIAGLPNAGNMAVPQVGGMQPGGTTAGSPEAWKTNAAQAAASGYSTIQQGQSAIESFLADSHIGNLRSALETNFSQDLLRISEEGKKEKNDYLSKLNEFIATTEATAQQNAVTNARLSTNDWYDFIAQLTNAGIKLSKQEMDALKPPTGSGGVKVVSQEMPTNPAYDWVEESPGVWRGTKLPTAPKPPKAPQPTGLVGPIQGSQKPPKGYVAVKSGGKTYWRKVGDGAGGAGANKPLTPEQKRIQFTTGKKFWTGGTTTTPFGVQKEPGINKAKVNGWTNAAGDVVPQQGIDPNKARQYVFNVRAFRLYEQVGSMTDSNERTAAVMKGVLGSANWTRFKAWLDNKTANDDFSYKAARRRKHI